MLDKNQRALLTFLEKHPDRWHIIRRQKALDAALGLMKHLSGVLCWNVGGMSIVRLQSSTSTKEAT